MTRVFAHYQIDNNVGGSIGKLYCISNQVYEHLLHTVDVDLEKQILTFSRIAYTVNQVNIFVLGLDFHNF